MNIVQPSVELLKDDNIFYKIEEVGRTCYKSSSERTFDSAKKFYTSLVNNKHYSILEHVNFVFEVNEDYFYDIRSNRFFNTSIEELEHGRERYLISANLRAINESKEMALLAKLWGVNPDLVYQQKSLLEAAEGFVFYADRNIHLVDIDHTPDIQEHAYLKHKYFSFRFICDRGVSHEIVRHRIASYAQESTRYCNYTKDKFGNEITVIEPFFWSKDSQKYKVWKEACENSEKAYFNLINLGASPQEARSVLPNSLKTELIMTANCEEFNHFFDVRKFGTTGKPHPQMQQVANIAYDLYLDNIKKFNK